MNKFKYQVLRVYWLIKIAYFSLRWIRKINLGDSVIYKGEVYRTFQGVCDPYWDITNGKETHHVHKEQFRKVVSIGSYWESYKSGFMFYKNYWLGIWIRNGIEDWCRNSKIW
jgi:hypothetical protein